MPFRFMSSISPTIAFSKDAFPNRLRTFARRTKLFSVPKPAYSSCVTASRKQLLRKSSSANQAFVRFTVESSTAPAIALNSTCFRNLSSGGLSFRELWPHPHRLTGASNPGPMLWAERSRSRGIFQGVFLRSKGTLSGHFVARDRPRNARQIGFGGGCGR